MDFLYNLLPAIEHFRMLGYWIVLLISAIEALAFIGVAIPGTVFLILLGFISAKGYLDLSGLIWFAAIGAILGDVASFYLGNHAKRFFQENNRIFKSVYLEKGKNFFTRHGRKSIFLGRFVGPLRPIIPFVAGLSKMKKSKFFSWDIISAFAWSLTFAFLGFFFGQAWQTIALWSSRIGVLAAAIAFFLIIFYVLKWLVFKKGRQFAGFIYSIWLSVKQAIIANPDVSKIIKKHPLFFSFFKQRFDKNKFLGLPATLLLLTFFYILSLFAGVVEDVITSDTIVAADLRIANLMAAFRSIEFTKVFLWVTLFGKWQIIFIFIIVAIVLLRLWKKQFYIIPLLLTVAGSGTFTMLGKLAFHRPRPQAAVYLEHSFSFPSGHATFAIAFYGFLVFIIWQNAKTWKNKINSFFAGTIIILAVGFSRLYLGVHYLSDVWGGYLVGSLWLIIGISFSLWLASGKKVEDKALIPFIKKKKIISLGLIAAALVFYAIFALHYNPPLNIKTPLKDKIIISKVLDIFSNYRFSKYTETLIGDKQEPLSFIIIAKDEQELIKVFRSGGWYLADRADFSSVAKIAKAAILKSAYSRGPMTPSFWNSEVHAWGFEKPTASNNARKRHHARFWRTQFEDSRGRHIYVGTVSLDVGIKWGVTHKIKPDIDTEREFLFNDLRTTGLISQWRKEQFVEPVLGKNFSGDPFFTDGNIYIATLK